MYNAASLKLIKEDLHSLLDSVVMELESLIKQHDAASYAVEAIGSLNRLKGTFSLVNLFGA